MANHKDYTKDMNCFDYYVNEKDRTIICKLNRFTWVEKFLGILGGKVLNDEWFGTVLASFYSGSILEIPEKQFIGKAVCSPDDEWDVEYGKQLARTRLEEKGMKLLRRVLSVFGERFVIANNEAFDKLDAYLKNVERSENYGKN